MKLATVFLALILFSLAAINSASAAITNVVVTNSGTNLFGHHLTFTATFDVPEPSTGCLLLFAATI